MAEFMQTAVPEWSITQLKSLKYYSGAEMWKQTNPTELGEIKHWSGIHYVTIWMLISYLLTGLPYVLKGTVHPKIKSTC